MEKTVFDDEARAALVARVMRVQTGMKPQWGQFNAVKMLRHVGAGVEMALGELKVPPRPGPLRNAFVRWLVIDSPMPLPKGAPTAQELLTQPTAGVEEEQVRLCAALERLVARGKASAWVEHPAFGQLDGRQWGKLIWKHVDHHLRQFGV